MKSVLVATASALCLLAAGCTVGEKSIEIKELRDKVSYGIGMKMGRDMKEQGADLNPDVIAMAIKDVLADKKPQLTEEQIVEAFTAYQQELVSKYEAKQKADSEANQRAGEAYLAENAKKDGVVTLPSGVQYKILTAGTGKKPTAADTVTVHYRGTLVDGKEFDSSIGRGEPATFPVSGVIPGWTEVLQLMQEGAKWQVAIPAKLAYGEHGRGPQIGPNATLVFEVELLKVLDPAKGK